MSPDPDSPQVAYKEADSVESLVVPPDLTRPAADGSMSVPGGDGSQGGTRSSVLPEFEGVRFVRAGLNSWLEVDATRPEEIWPRLVDFLRSEGLQVARREPALGIVETGWAERRDKPGTGGLFGFVGDFFSSSADIRDKYVVRLERTDEAPAGTRIFVTHRSAQEVNTNPDSPDTRLYDWVQSAGNPAIEAEMSRRLLVYLGLSQEGAGAVIGDPADALDAEARYVLTDGGAARVMVADPRQRRVFARVGDALGEVGADVLSSNQDRGRYVLRWVPPKDVVDTGGFLGLFGGGDPEPVELQLRLRKSGQEMRIKAADADGTIRSGAVHRALLRRLAVALGADPAAVEAAEQRGQEAEPDYGDDEPGPY